jgi:hypothetical protein
MPAVTVCAEEGALAGRMEFPVPGDNFPVLFPKIPCLILQGNSAKDAEIPRFLKRCRCRGGLGFANFPVFFPDSREFGAETGSHWTASSAST